MVITSDAPRATFGAADRIRTNLPRMSQALVKIAELVQGNPVAPIELSITELADRAGTSAATVTRFCRMLGYGGYLQFRVALAGELGTRDAEEVWKVDLDRQFAAEDSPEHVLRTLLSTHAQSVEDTASRIDLDAVGRLAARIWECRHLDIYGVGGSAAMAAEMQNRLYRIGVPCHVWSEAHDGLASAALQDDRCVAIALSVSGRTVEVVDMLRRAAASGALAVAITSAQDAPLARVADVTVVTASPNPYLQPGDLSTRPSQLLVLDLLYLLVAQQDFSTAAARLVATRMAVSAHRRTSPSARSREVPA